MEKVIITITDERVGGSVFNYPLDPAVSDTLFSAVIQSLGYEGTEYQEQFVLWVLAQATEIKEQLIRATKSREAAEEIEALREGLGL